MLFGIVAGLIGFCVFLVLHWTLFHWRVVRPTLSGVLGLWTLSLFASLVACYLAASTPFPRETIGHPVVRGLTCLIVFACSFVVYMPFYYVIGTSLSVQTIIIIDEAGPSGCSRDFLDGIFASRDLLQKRLQTLVTNGYLIQHGNRFVATKKGSRMGGLFLALKNLWRLGPGG